MNLSSLFILRPVMTTLLTIALITGGIVAYQKLPISNLPDVNYPTNYGHCHLSRRKP